MLTLRTSVPPVVLPLVLLLMTAGCVSERERREASQPRRPAMPAMVGEPGPLRSPPAEDAVLEAVGRAAAAGDQALAERWLRDAGDGGVRARVVRTVAGRLAAGDPLAALAFAQSVPSGPARTGAVEIAARAQARREPAGAGRWAVEFVGPADPTIVRRAVAEELVARDARAEARAMLALPAGGARDEMLGFLAAAWARRDPGEAERWAREQPGEVLRLRLTASVAFEIAQTDPPRAMALLEALPAGRDRWLLVTAIAQTWVAVDARKAFAWTHQLPAGEARDAAVAGLDAGLGIAVARRVTAPPNTGSGTSRRAGGAASGDPTLLYGPAFAAWRATRSADLAEDEAILAYVRERGGMEPVLVGQWLETLPGGTLREQAAEAFWETLLRVSPAEAARWLQERPRSERSPDWEERTARAWLRLDPAAAAAWLRERSLPPERIEWLLQEARRE